MCLGVYTYLRTRVERRGAAGSSEAPAHTRSTLAHADSLASQYDDASSVSDTSFKSLKPTGKNISGAHGAFQEGLLSIFRTSDCQLFIVGAHKLVPVQHKIFIVILIIKQCHILFLSTQHLQKSIADL